MQRWRTQAGDTLAEAPPEARVRFYLLDPSGSIRTTYGWNQYSVQEELITVAYAIAGNELRCYSHCEIGDTIVQSHERSELEGLIELSPDESPTAREVLAVVATDRATREANEAAIRVRVAAAAAPAGPAHADLALALANSVVRWPLHSRAEADMLDILVQLDALPHGALPAAATGSILAAARQIAEPSPWDGPVMPAARSPAPAAELAPEVAELLAALEALEARLPQEAIRADENSDSIRSEFGNRLRLAAEHLHRAIGEIV